jgi:hypothetical protein
MQMTMLVLIVFMLKRITGRQCIGASLVGEVHGESAVQSATESPKTRSTAGCSDAISQALHALRYEAALLMRLNVKGQDAARSSRSTMLWNSPQTGRSLRQHNVQFEME